MVILLYCGSMQLHSVSPFEIINTQFCRVVYFNPINFEIGIYGGILTHPDYVVRFFSRRVYMQPNHAACSSMTAQILVAWGNTLQTIFSAPRIKLEDVRPGPCETLFVILKLSSFAYPNLS